MAKKFNAQQTVAEILPNFDGSREKLAQYLLGQNSDLLAQLKRQVHTRGDAGIGKMIERNRQLLAALEARP